MPRRLPSFALFAFGLCILPSCSWCPWGQEKEPTRFGIVSVQLNTRPPKGKKQSYAVAQVHHGSRLKDAGFQTLSKEGTASFVLPMGNLYDLRIFYDLNRNQVHDPNEPSGLVQNVAPAPSSGTIPPPLTMAFGVVGPIAGVPERKSTAPSAPPPSSGREIPTEARPYVKYVPQWLQDKALE